MYYCVNCGYKSVKWLGKCPLCEGWETFVEEKEEDKSNLVVKEKTKPKLLKEFKGQPIERFKTNFEEFDNILGGGLVNGEVILVGGEPGVGKSTLLLEIAMRLSLLDKTLYVSAEESLEQLTLRSRRIKYDYSNLYILGEDNLDLVYEHIKEENFKFVIIDSIQVVYSKKYDGIKGSANQIRGCADFLVQIAKTHNVVIFIVGHVTKEGIIAGPKLLEHIVDCVLYFEGESLSNYRILRTTKNRFGPSGDIAVFEMTSDGLKELKTTDDIFLPHREKFLSGSAITCVLEGTRPVLIELQALVSRASFGVVRRRSLGFDFNRFSLLVAIIEKRLKISIASEDIFLNVAGGLKIDDPAADLAALVSILLSLKEKEIKMDTVFIGEIGLSGEIRHISNINLRLKEIVRAKFNFCIIPFSNLKEVDKKFDLNIIGYSNIKEVFEHICK